jgi:hypothetical protein
MALRLFFGVVELRAAFGKARGDRLPLLIGLYASCNAS